MSTGSLRIPGSKPFLLLKQFSPLPIRLVSPQAPAGCKLGSSLVYHPTLRRPILPLSPSTARTRLLSTSHAKMSEAFLAAVKARRTHYALKNTSPISDARISELVKETILHAPSSFNSQSTRIVVLIGAEHEKLWDIAKEAVKAAAPAEQWPASEKKLNGFKGGYGTALFYEDPQVIAALQKAAPLYADKFPQWSEHTNGMHTFVLWAALEAEGLGANLQHYNPLIDQRVSEEWNVPQDWSLQGQLVFGTPVVKPSEKTFKPLEDRVFVHGAKI